MATIKSYTDLSQSKVLAGILPLKSADMYYPSEVVLPKFGVALSISNNIPCWSLAALLDVLPNGIVMNKDSQNNKYHFSSKYIRTYVTADSPIDACVAMILKLNELNLL